MFLSSLSPAFSVPALSGRGAGDAGGGTTGFAAAGASSARLLATRNVHPPSAIVAAQLLALPARVAILLLAEPETAEVSRERSLVGGLTLCRQC